MKFSHIFCTALFMITIQTQIICSEKKQQQTAVVNEQKKEKAIEADPTPLPTAKQIAQWADYRKFRRNRDRHAIEQRDKSVDNFAKEAEQD